MRPHPPSTLDAEIDFGEILQKGVPVVFDGRIADSVFGQIGGHEHQRGGGGREEDEEEDERRTRRHERLHVLKARLKHLPRRRYRRRRRRSQGEEEAARPTTVESRGESMAFTRKSPRRKRR